MADIHSFVFHRCKMLLTHNCPPTSDVNGKHLETVFNSKTLQIKNQYIKFV